jgi:hypothetical protein
MMELAEMEYKEAMEAVTDWYEVRIARDIALKPGLTYAQIGLEYGVEASFVARCAVKHKVRRPRGNGSPASRGRHAKS